MKIMTERSQTALFCLKYAWFGFWKFIKSQKLRKVTLLGSVETQLCAHVWEFYTDALKHKKDRIFRPWQGSQIRLRCQHLSPGCQKRRSQPLQCLILMAYDGVEVKDKVKWLGWFTLGASVDVLWDFSSMCDVYLCVSGCAAGVIEPTLRYRPLLENLNTPLILCKQLYNCSAADDK